MCKKADSCTLCVISAFLACFSLASGCMIGLISLIVGWVVVLFWEWMEN